MAALLVSITTYSAYSTTAVVIRRLNKEAKLDYLTGLPNRRALSKYWRVNVRDSDIVSVAIVDIDDFKKFNDRYGHIIGDKVLRHVANLLQTQMSTIGIASRAGGEEFVLLTRQNSGSIFEETVRLIAATPFFYQDRCYPVTVSLGAHITDINSSKVQLINLLEQADKAVYQSKNDGKNTSTITVAHSMTAPENDS